MASRTSTCRSALFFSLALTVDAAALTAGNIVVQRITTFTSSASALILDEYTSAGSLVQSISLPTTSSGSANACTQGGTTLEGFGASSPDGSWVAFSCYGADVGTATVSTAVSMSHVIARLGPDGFVNTSTRSVDTFSAASSNFRGAAIANDGLTVFGSDVKGVFAATIPNTNSLLTYSANSRNIQIYTHAAAGTVVLVGGASSMAYALVSAAATSITPTAVFSGVSTITALDSWVSGG